MFGSDNTLALSPENKRGKIMANKSIHIFGGGTISHVRNHLALCAPAYGTTAKTLKRLFEAAKPLLDIHCHLTMMAGGDLETHEEVGKLVDELVADPATKIIIMSAALVDFNGNVDNKPSGRHGDRLKSRNSKTWIDLQPAEKILPRIRQKRKDIFLVGFKTTTGATEDEQYIAGLNLLKESSCNLVLANDVISRVNMIITPEEARYHVTKNRDEVLRNLVEMALLRSHLTFTRSTVVAGDKIPWDSPLVPNSLREVVDYCIMKGAYKPFRGATVGHFACKLDDKTFLTSIRKSNFNDLPTTGLVKVVTDGPDSVIAYGRRPSVGGQSQRIVFNDHRDYDCIVHFHSPRKEGSEVPVVSQREYECGSHECGRNTSQGLKKFGNLSAVFLDQHGPNIVFNHSINPQEVIDFIDKNFDLSEKTGGYVTLGDILKTPDHLDDLKEITGGLA
jgi:hypothetical protein